MNNVLTLDTILAIQNDTRFHTEIAETYGLSKSKIGRIKRGEVASNRLFKQVKAIDGAKKCNACGQFKLLEEYHPNKQCSSGVTGTCRDCEWVRRKQWYADNRQRRQEAANLRNKKRKLELVNGFGNKCLDCNNTYPICVYQFHHLDPLGKDMNPSAAIAMSKENRERELSKCVMLCANCHMIRHYGKSDLTDRLEEENDS